MVHVGTKHAGTRTPSEQHQCLGLSQCHVGEESSLDGGVGMGPGCSENRVGTSQGWESRAGLGPILRAWPTDREGRS